MQDLLRMRLCCAAIFLLHICSANSVEIQNCSFEDTVNLTDSKQLSNGSYLYEGVVIPPELIGLYDYEELYAGKRRPVPTHTRGCVCKLKKCVKFCCNPSEIKVEGSWQCARQFNDELQYSPFVNITLANNSRVQVHVLQEFVVQQGIPCHEGYILSPLEYWQDEWEMFENTTILRISDQAYLSRRDYCFTPFNLNGTYTLNPLTCSEKNYFRLQLHTIVMFVSIPFLLATALVYRRIPQLYNLHGKCLICYLVSLAIGFSILVFVKIAPEQSPVTCGILGFIGFYFVVAIFYWLSVICFDLWHNFAEDKYNMPQYRRWRCKNEFQRYSLYAWGLPTLWTIVTVVCQFSGIRSELKPGIGDTHCWLNPEGWAAIIYFYGPSLPLLIFNIVMFILISIKIYKIKKELRTFEYEEQENLRKQQDNVTLFLRLFIITGLSWVFEVVAFIARSPNEMHSDIFELSDIYNAAQGIIIFGFFVLKRKVLLLIKNRNRRISRQ